MSGPTKYSQSDFGTGGLNNLDVDELVDEIGLTTVEIKWRKDFIRFDQGEVQRLDSCQDVFADHVQEIAEVNSTGATVVNHDNRFAGEWTHDERPECPRMDRNCEKYVSS